MYGYDGKRHFMNKMVSRLLLIVAVLWCNACGPHRRRQHAEIRRGWGAAYPPARTPYFVQSRWRRFAVQCCAVATDQNELYIVKLINETVTTKRRTLLSLPSRQVAS